MYNSLLLINLMHNSHLSHCVCLMSFEAKIRRIVFFRFFAHCCEKWVKAIGDDCDCQAQPLISARRSFLQMRSGLFVAPVLRDWLLLFYSFHLCLVYARLCVTAWVNLQFAVTSSKTKLLSRILNQSDAAAAAEHLRSKQKQSESVPFFLSYSLTERMFPGRKS